MGREKDDLLKKEEAKTAAAAAKGRICSRCGSVVEFDDSEPTRKGMLCASCRNAIPKD